MAFVFEENAAGLVYIERQPVWVRVFIAAVGTGMLIIPIAAVREGAWRGLSFAALLSVLLVVLTLLFAWLMWMAALRGEQRIVFDSRQRMVLDKVRGPFGTRHSGIGFDRIESLEVVRREAVDDPPYYQIELRIAGRRRPFQLGSFATPAEAEHWRARIAAQVSFRQKPS